MYYIIIFYIGCIISSFLLWVASESLHPSNHLLRRSKCDYCGHPLSYCDLFPLFSQVYHRSRCRYCQRSYSSLYLIGECMGGSLFLYLYFIYCSNLSINIFFLLLVSILLLLMSYCDLLEGWVPDKLQLLLAIIIFLFSPSLSELRLSSSHLIFYAFFLLLYLFFPSYIGGADIKLFSLLIPLLEISTIPLFILAASSSALLWVITCTQVLDKPIPRHIRFVPFIFFAFCITFPFQ